MAKKVKISPSTKKGEFVFFDGENEIKIEFTNIFTVSSEVATRISNRQLKKEVRLIVLCRIGKFGYSIFIRKIKGSEFSVSIDFEEAFILSLDPLLNTALFFESELGTLHIQKTVLINNQAVPGGIAYYDTAHSIEELMGNADMRMSSLINCFQLEK